jgi:hypothetical protein
MEILRLSKEVDSEGRLLLSLDVGMQYKNKSMELVVFDKAEDMPEKKAKPEIDKYFGKLKWKGDPLEEQRKLRNEWD